MGPAECGVEEAGQSDESPEAMSTDEFFAVLREELVCEIPYDQHVFNVVFEMREISPRASAPSVTDEIPDSNRHIGHIAEPEFREVFVSSRMLKGPMHQKKMNPRSTTDKVFHVESRLSV